MIGVSIEALETSTSAATKSAKWLADEDIAHYHKIVIAINETIRIMGGIDEVIEEHDGWLGAFMTATGTP